MNRLEASKILGISLKANEDDIKKAFRKKAMILHPDRNKAPDARIRFIELHEAYEYLTENIGHHFSNESTHEAGSHYTKHQKPKFRSSGYAYRSYSNPYENMSREEFEERYRRAQKAAEEMLDRKSKIIYQNSLLEYQETWRRKFAVVMAGIGIVLAFLFILDFALGTKEQKIRDGEVRLRRVTENRARTYYLNVNDVYYKLPQDLYYIYNKSIPSKYIINNGKQVSISQNNNTNVEIPKPRYSLNRTKIFKDIIGITIHYGQNYHKLQPIASAFGSFPLVPILLLIPFISLWREKPKFNFVFFIVNFNIYVFPIFTLILLFHDGRLLRLFGL